ncbi:agamous-like MADS-box protein AGL80 [Andrographis paniculata]|uniref:agamous-like MADS-box protein AGL80 n=1 Tax=Andrographis paniculata TaxID=175694 RepID=UPI0021E87B4F|nr:agamous-like MADS-box protein AGL80 [Andrographis paniculata]
MTMRGIKQEQIANENEQNSVIFKQKEDLVEEAEQLRNLYGVDIAIIGHQQGGESNVILWPSPDEVAEQVTKFTELPELEKNKNMVTHESYLEEIIKNEKENVNKLMKAIAVKEGNQLLAKKPLDDMHFTELKIVNEMVNDMIKKLKKRAEELNQEGHQVLANGSSSTVGGFSSATAGGGSSDFEGFSSGVATGGAISNDAGFEGFFGGTTTCASSSTDLGEVSPTNTDAF